METPGHLTVREFAVPDPEPGAVVMKMALPGANVPCGRCYFCVNGHPYYFCRHLEDYGDSVNLTRI
jgi:hypothetical protein